MLMRWMKDLISLH